jgi:hypothetical protein
VIKAIGGLANDTAIPRWTILVGQDALPFSSAPDTGEWNEWASSVFFHWLANADPERDRYLSICGRRVAIDATPKLPGDAAHGLPVRSWPPLIRMDEGTREKVNQRWSAYGLDS